MITALTVVSPEWAGLLGSWSERVRRHATEVAFGRVAPATPTWKWEALLSLSGQVLYLDVDLWLVRDIREELAGFDFSKIGMVIDQGIYCCGSASNVHQRFVGGVYCNAGVLLIDMGNPAHREVIVQARNWLAETVARCGLTGGDAWFMEQTAINMAVHRSGLFRSLHPGLNYMPHVTQSGPPPDPVYAVHAAGCSMSDKECRLAEFEERFI